MVKCEGVRVNWCRQMVSCFSSSIKEVKHRFTDSHTMPALKKSKI